jgi:hypothetical protein
MAANAAAMNAGRWRTTVIESNLHAKQHRRINLLFFMQLFSAVRVPAVRGHCPRTGATRGSNRASCGSRRVVRGRGRDTSNRDAERRLLYVTLEQIRDTTHDQTAHHEGSGESGEF